MSSATAEMVESIVPTYEEIQNLKPIPNFQSKGEKTFQFQSRLPSLPLPDLETTMAKYLESVRPHVTEEEYKRTEEIVWRFCAGPGRLLQMQLEDKARRERNWMDRYWLEEAYLKLRWPLAPFLNTTGPTLIGYSMFRNVTDGMDAEQKRRVQREFASIGCHTSGRFWQLIRNEQLVIGRAMNGDRFCMSQFKQLYSTCRVPGRTMDELRVYFRTASEGDSPTHAVVICGGRFFTLRVLTADYELLSPAEIELQLRSIQERCDGASKPPHAGLGALTSEYRDKWAELRSHLVTISPSNARHLETIESAMFVLVLDDAEPQTVHAVCRETLCGNAANRWFDKSLQLVVFANGLTAVNAEHSPFEGTVSATYGFFSDLCLLENNGRYEGFFAPATLFGGAVVNTPAADQPHSTNVRVLAAPSELEFVVDGRIREAIGTALHQFAMHCSAIELCIEAYDGYGKKFLRQFGLHPDTVVQCALQLAYYRLYGRPAPTYETASCRRFYRGRTETIRSCTSEMTDWCKAMLDAKVHSKDRWHLFQRAMHKHNALREVCQKNAGCDRHLLGLKRVAEEFGSKCMQELLEDPSWVKSGGGGNYILSTSFSGYLISIGGVTPMCEHGYGSFYTISNDKVRIFMSAWVPDEDTSARSLMDAWKQSMDEVKQIIEKEGTKAPRSLSDLTPEQQEELRAIFEKQQLQSKI